MLTEELVVEEESECVGSIVALVDPVLLVGIVFEVSEVLVLGDVLVAGAVVVYIGLVEFLDVTPVVEFKVWVLLLVDVVLDIALEVGVGFKGEKVEPKTVVLVVLEKRTKMDVVGRKTRTKQKKPRPPMRTFLRFISLLFTGFYSTVTIQERPLSPPLKSW